MVWLHRVSDGSAGRRTRCWIRAQQVESDHKDGNDEAKPVGQAALKVTLRRSLVALHLEKPSTTGFTRDIWY
ncbi:hypothetical protein AN416_09485 [Paraburkholderia caribensis]|nr:hypothetical protein AN416_09485 [Paraburkholderia caribensis]